MSCVLETTNWPTRRLHPRPVPCKRGSPAGSSTRQSPPHRPSLPARRRSKHHSFGALNSHLWRSPRFPPSRLVRHLPSGRGGSTRVCVRRAGIPQPLTVSVAQGSLHPPQSGRIGCGTQAGGNADSASSTHRSTYSTTSAENKQPCRRDTIGPAVIVLPVWFRLCRLRFIDLALTQRAGWLFTRDTALLQLGTAALASGGLRITPPRGFSGT